MRLDHLLSKEKEKVRVVLLLICQEANKKEKFLVTMRIGDTPVLIPNTMVKTLAADGTMLETAWESRWLPDSHGGVAQLGEHLPCKQGVMSSNLTISIRCLEHRKKAK